MNNAERLAFAEKLIGRTVAEQTAAGNAEGWISSRLRYGNRDRMVRNGFLFSSTGDGSPSAESAEDCGHDA